MVGGFGLVGLGLSKMNKLDDWLVEWIESSIEIL